MIGARLPGALGALLVLLAADPALPGSRLLPPSVATGGLTAQERPGRLLPPRDVGLKLREAAGLEASGDHAAAEAVLREILETNPSSSGALFALERVLRAQGRVGDVLPPADRYLEAEPGSDGVRFLKLRILQEVDSVGALEAEARAWIAAEPRAAAPYLEVARIFLDTFGPDRALAVLDEGAAAGADPRALALETGDILLEAGREAEAVAAWGRAVGPEGEGLTGVLRRLEAAEGDPARLARPLVAELAGEPTTPDRLRAATRVALEAGLEEEALETARAVVAELDGTALRGFLTDVARRGEEAGSLGVVRWAYRELRDRSRDPGERRALDVRLSSAALAAGDTAAAVEIRARGVEGLPEGSPEHRQAVAELLRLEAGRREPADLAAGLEAFRATYPAAPELDPLAAEVARVLMAAGDTARARGALEGVAGPRSERERAFLLLHGGRISGAVSHLDSAAATLPAVEATAVLQLRALLTGLQDPARSLVGRSAALAHTRGAAAAVEAVREGVGGVPAGDRPAVLAHGARLADQGGAPDAAARLRRTLVESHPDAPETSEAYLELARYHARELGEVAEAMRLLETLIVERPDAPVVPGARRELDRLRRSGGGEGP